MSQDPTDLVAYKLWLVASPFIVQQPPSQPPNGHVILNQERSMQLPVSAGRNLMSSVNDVLPDPSQTSVQLPRRGRKRSVSGPGNDTFAVTLENSGDRSTHDKNGTESELVKRLQSNTQAFPGSTLLPGMSSYDSQGDMQQRETGPRTVCQACGKWFRSRQQLTQHMLVHTDVRKYRCNFCGRAFKQPSHLQQHHRIHTGEKPYRCPLAGCSRAFPQLSNLNHHLRNHDKPDPPTENTCMFCHRTYASEAVLKNHMAKIHMYQVDSAPKATTPISDNSNKPPTPVPGNMLGSPPQTPTHAAVPGLTFGTFPTMGMPAVGSFSEQLRNLASQPKRDGIPSGQRRDSFGSDMFLAEERSAMCNSKIDNITSALNPFQIFNTIPLEAIRQRTVATDEQITSNEGIEALSKMSSTGNVTNGHGLSPGFAHSSVTMNPTTTHETPVTGAHISARHLNEDCIHKDAAWKGGCNTLETGNEQTENNYKQIKQENTINHQDAYLSENEKTSNSTHERKIQRRTIAPVRLGSPEIAAGGSDVGLNSSFSDDDFSEASVCENYNYTLDNSEEQSSEWEGGHSIGKPVVDNILRTMAAHASAPFTPEKPEVMSNTEETSVCHITETMTVNSKVSVDMCYEINYGTSELSVNNSHGEKLEHGTVNSFHDASDNKVMLNKKDIESCQPNSHITDQDIAYTIASMSTYVPDRTSQTGKLELERFENNRQNGTLVSNARKRKAFQPQRVLYDSEMIDYCL